ncbi:MAG: hypothetical protein HZC40_16785 [Chloroflexi bacterium]|nr:hypothetical protein [Chloroflexota bacterium]
MNGQNQTRDGKDKKIATVASLLLFGGALIAAPWLRTKRATIEQATARAVTRGRDLVKRVAEKFNR